jgi:hypothetical protein
MAAGQSGQPLETAVKIVKKSRCMHGHVPNPHPNVEKNAQAKQGKEYGASVSL